MRRDLKDRKDKSGHYISTEEPSMLKSQIFCLILKETRKKRGIFRALISQGYILSHHKKQKQKKKHYHYQKDFIKNFSSS